MQTSSVKKQSKNTKKSAILKGIQTGLKEVKLIQKGKLKGVSLKEVLDKL